MSVRSGKGDKGFTELSFKKKVPKDSVQIHAIGDLDELNCYIGLVKTKLKSRSERVLLEKMQHDISTIASEISVASEKKRKLGHLLAKEDADWIKDTVVKLENKVTISPSFHLPGSGEISAFLDVARAVARRAERAIVSLYKREKSKNSHILTYINCTSDVLFILARKKARGERKVKAKKGKA